MDTKILIAILLGSLLFISGIAVFTMRRGPVGARPTTTVYNEQIVGQFLAWQAKFGKVYATEEEANYRLATYINTVHRINAQNAKTNSSYKAGFNQFSDMSLDELKLRVLMIKTVPNVTQGTYQVPSTPAASSVDWRTQGAVTPVKDQGQCGSCWSFSTTGVLEGTNKLFGAKDLKSFAEQQLVDCCGKDGFQCEGCSGAWPEWAVNYVIAKGITTEDQYAYQAVEGQCNESKVTSQFKVSKFNLITSGKEQDVINAVNQQPVSICVDATTWFDYSSGIYDGCPTDIQLDHAVLLVGYTSTYYIVKNSWATTWGEDGYIRLPRGNNPCGIANHALTTSV